MVESLNWISLEDNRNRLAELMQSDTGNQMWVQRVIAEPGPMRPRQTLLRIPARPVKDWCVEEFRVACSHIGPQINIYGMSQEDVNDAVRRGLLGITYSGDTAVTISYRAGLVGDGGENRAARRKR
jgi:hypothetical protein